MLIAANKRGITGIDMYKIGIDWAMARNDFYDAFSISIKHFYDGLCTFLFGQIQIDIFKFDEYLHKKYGEYEREGKSLNDIVTEHYGAKGLKVLIALLPSEDTKLSKAVEQTFLQETSDNGK